MTTPCFSEPVLALYVDGELPPAEAREVEAHLASCPSCGAVVEALRGEGRLLARVLEEAPFAAPARRRAVWADLATIGLCFLGAAAGFQSVFGWLGEVGNQSPVGLSAQSLVVNVLFDTVFYLAREGASMLTPLVSTLGVVALLVLTAVFLYSVRRRPTAGTLPLLLALVGLAAPSQALEQRIARSKHGEIVVPAHETVDDSLLAVGETVSVDGIVTGNLIACGERVIVRGTVKGDLLAGGQRVEIAGTVEGNVMGAAQTLVVRGPVGRSLHTVSEHLAFDREGRVEGDMVALAGRMDLEGRVGRDVFAFGGPANIKGDFGRNVSTWTDRVRVDGPATIGGDLTAHAREKERVTIAPEATVRGKTDTRIETPHRRSRYARPSFYVWRVIWLAAAFLTGLLAHWLFPGLFSTRPDGALSLGKAAGVGFVALVAAPVGIVVVALTMVGLPLALLALAVWCGGLYLSSIFVGALVGRALLARPDGAAPSFAIALLVGLAVVSVAVHMPYVGFILSPLVALFGMGIGVIQVGRAWRAVRPA